MFLDRFAQLENVVKSCSVSTDVENVTLDQSFKMIHFLLNLINKQNGCVFVVGNGGSSGIASHFVVDLLRTLKIAASTLTDSCAATCFGNDFGYDKIFSEQLNIRMQFHDLLIAISSSGKSPNILNAVQVANDKGAQVITFSGFSSSNPLRGKGDLNFWIDSSDYGLVESAHFLLLHSIIDTYELNVNSLNLTNAEKD